MKKALCTLWLVAFVAASCVGPERTTSPTAPTEAAQTAVSPDPVKAKGQTEIHPTHPPAGATLPSVIGFPPRNEPNAFFQDLTALYRDALGRTQSAPTYVDPEGENVWLTEYFRFYLNGCTHQEAVSRTLAEITTGGSQPVCGQETPSFPPRNLPNEFQGQLENTYRNVLGRPQVLSYVDSEGANVWLAQYLRFRVSGCSHAVAQAQVFTEIRGGGVQPTCAAQPPVPSQPPVARFTVTPDPGTPVLAGQCAVVSVNGPANLLQCRFDASASDGAITEYRWTFPGQVALTGAVQQSVLVPCGSFGGAGGAVERAVSLSVTGPGGSNNTSLTVTFVKASFC